MSLGVNLPTKMLHMTILCSGVLYFYYSFGVGYYLFPSYGSETFHYPLDIDIRAVADKHMTGEPVDTDIINQYSHGFLSKSLVICNSIRKYDLVIMVKSDFQHFNHRNAIRQTYGRENHIPGINLKTVFFIGKDRKGTPAGAIMQDKIALESKHFKDVIQLDFPDRDESVTNKTMMTLRWAVEYCAQGDYYLIVEDDMYISVDNLLGFVHNNDKLSKVMYNTPELKNNTKDATDIMYAGHVKSSAVLKLQSSPFANISNEYKWWPPYVTTGAYVLSNKALQLLYIGSLYVQHFVYDDVFLGIVAFRMKMNLTHSHQFLIQKKKFTRNSYRNVIACHGFGDQEELVSVWQSHYN